MEFFEVVKKRRSIRDYKKDEVSKEDLLKLIDAARMAPSANNIQPWEFVIVTDKNLKLDLYNIIKNNAPFLKEAPAAIVVFSENTKYYLEDCSAATENILLAATNIGLGSCWIAGDKKPYADDVKKLLKVPDNYKLVSIVVIGYPFSDTLPNVSKRNLEDVVHWNGF